MHTFSFEQSVRTPQNVVSQTLQGESVLLNLKTEEYFGLDDIGTRMWHVLHSTHSIQSAFDTLQKEYDVDPETLELDIQNLLLELLDNGLVELV